MRRLELIPSTTTTTARTGGRRTPLGWRRLIALVLVAGVATACGGGDDDSADAPAADDVPAADGAPADDAASDDPTTDAPADDSADAEPAAEPAPSGGGGDWCGLAQEIENETMLGENGIDPFGEGADTLKEAMQQILDLAPTVRDRAPSEIADDVDIVFSTLEQMNDVLAEADYDLLKVDPTAFEGFGSADIEQASANIQRYNEEVCGIVSSVSSDDGDVPAVSLPAEAEDALNDSVAQALADGWDITVEQASCLLDQVDMSELAAGDPSILQQAFDACGIDPSVLAG